VADFASTGFQGETIGASEPVGFPGKGRGAVCPFSHSTLSSSYGTTLPLPLREFRIPYGILPDHCF